MQQVQPSIRVLLSKKRGLKQRLQIAWDSDEIAAQNRESPIGNLWASAGQTPTSESFSYTFFFENFFSFHRPGKRWENCWLASMEAAADQPPLRPLSPLDIHSVPFSGDLDEDQHASGGRGRIWLWFLSAFSLWTGHERNASFPDMLGIINEENIRICGYP